MLETYEVRWFFDSPLPAFRDWGGTREQRTDWYAQIASETSSVKLRDTNIESKFLLDQSRARIVSAEVLLQRWTKLSRPVSRDDERQLMDAVRSNWLDIAKDRTVRHYSASGADISRKQAETVEAVQVEWAQVSLRERQKVWTLCLEASTHLGEESLLRVAAHLFEQTNPDVAMFPTAQSYPDWIVQQIGTTQ